MNFKYENARKKLTASETLCQLVYEEFFILE